MNVWLAILLGSAAVYSWKIVGSMLPKSVLNHPLVSRLANLITVALLASLFAVQGFTSSQEAGTAISFDARIPAILVATVLLALRAPFILVVATAALISSAIRYFL